MSNFYIYPHLGLGDQIICNAIVRNVCRKFPQDNVILFCEKQFIETVKFMYRDIPNLYYILGGDGLAHSMLDGLPDTEKLYIGHHHLFKNVKGSAFDEAFYQQVGLSFSKRWSDFYVKRDTNREEKLFNLLKPKGEYIFIHQDINRGLLIDGTNIINPKHNVVSPIAGLTDNIFDYLMLIENAKEIHCIDSSFKLMIDSMLENRDGLFFHVALCNGIRKDPLFYSSSKLNWRVII